MELNQPETQETENQTTPETLQQETTPTASMPEITQAPPAPPEPPTPQNTLTTPHIHNHSQKQHHKHALSATIIIILITTSLVSAASLYSVYTLNTQVTTLQTQLQTITNQIQTSTNGATTASYTSSDSLTALYNNAIDSVVTIECKIVTTYTMPFGRGQQSLTSTAQGSGFVTQYNGQYLIITNNHVIADASSITVTFADGNTYTATVLKADSSKDLAILKCTDAPTSQYHALTFTSSATVSVGEAVVAIGSPYGLSGTMTTGIISALDRTITASDENTGTSENITGLLQTSAPINSGNSGGPLLTYDGKVIGITTAIVSNSDGLGFAVPSDTIQGFIQETLK
jgi:S1-C subfamily serine protease